jgi:chromosomal replication initiation ATPase DnaA
VARRLLERDQEIATLEDAAREAVTGTGSVVLLHGEAGIGKTSLVSAIRSQLPTAPGCWSVPVMRSVRPARSVLFATSPLRWVRA